MKAPWAIRVILLACWLPATASQGALLLNGIWVESPETSVVLGKGETLTIEQLSSRLADALQAEAKQGTLVATGEGTWLFQPPTNGWHSELTLTRGRTQTRVHVFLGERPGAGIDRLRGYPLGRYPNAELPVLVRVSKDAAAQHVSKHFRLGDLVSRLPDQWPRYVAFNTALLEQLELVQKVLKDSGWPGERIQLQSAFRTPRHNRRVGGASRSRHIYGDAADLIADADNDGRMDDLNGNGRTDRGDVDWLIARVQRSGVPIEIGGFGSYETDGPAGAFLHIDARGRAADWEH